MLVQNYTTSPDIKITSPTHTPTWWKHVIYGFGVFGPKTLASTSVLKATCLEYEHGEEDVFIEVVGLLITGATLVRVWVNVSNVQ